MAIYTQALQLPSTVLLLAEVRGSDMMAVIDSRLDVGDGGGIQEKICTTKFCWGVHLFVVMKGRNSGRIS